MYEGIKLEEVQVIGKKIIGQYCIYEETEVMLSFAECVLSFRSLSTMFLSPFLKYLHILVMYEYV